jgi:predicted esterase
MDPSRTFTVEPAEAHTHTHTLILLHGLGSNGYKFGAELLDTATDIRGLRLQQLLPGVKFMFPTSKRRRSRAFGRAVINQWFEVSDLQDPSHMKERMLDGLSESAAAIMELVRRESAAVGGGNVVLGGLSQGMATGLSALLCLDRPIGGFVGMSGYLPFMEDIEEAINDESDGDDEDNPFATDDQDEQKVDDPTVRAAMFERDLLCIPAPEVGGKETTAAGTPIFLGHGELDDRVVPRRAEEAARVMRAAGFDVELRMYEGLGHWYKIPDEIEDLMEFLQTTVGWPAKRILP